MASGVRIVVAIEDQASRALIQRAVAQRQTGQVVAETRSDVELLDAVKYRRPQLVFISTDLSDARGFAIAGRLSRQFPGLYIVMISPRQGDVEDLRQAMRAGARECLYSPLAETDILRILEEAGEVGQATTGRRGSVIAVTSSKGGVGKSTIAVNLSIALRQQQPGRVVLVDGDLFFGDIATLLNLKPERTIYDLNQALEAEIADQFLCQHTSGIEVLAAPVRTEQAEEIAHDRFRAILHVLQTLYDVVIVDATVSAFDTMLATLDVADLAILLTTLDVVCLKDVAQMVDVLEKLRFPAHNVILIGNRYEERLSVSPKNAERAVGKAFGGIFPHDDRVVIAANQGIPLISTEPGAPFSQRIRGLAKMVTDRTGRVDHVPA
jgi:pilus assembly protein CpaE